VNIIVRVLGVPLSSRKHCKRINLCCARRYQDRLPEIYAL
jgi:hypothetical protein